jgi:hypothetical protein
VTSFDERQFLHDLSTPLMVSHGNLVLLLEKLRKDPAACQTPAFVEKMEKALLSIEKVSHMVSARRDHLRS